MNQKHLTQVWQWMSVVCVLFLVTSVVSIQGGSEFVGKLFGDKAGSLSDNKPAIGYFGAIVGGVLFLIASFVLLLHAYRHGNRWCDRVPVVWLEGLDTKVWDGKAFQIVALLLFLGIPAAGIILCVEEAEVGDICELDTTHFYTGSGTTLIKSAVSTSRAFSSSSPARAHRHLATAFPAFQRAFLEDGQRSSSRIFTPARMTASTSSSL
jgi:hypothetical protein